MGKSVTDTVPKAYKITPQTDFAVNRLFHHSLTATLKCIMEQSFSDQDLETRPG